MYLIRSLLHERSSVAKFIQVQFIERIIHTFENTNDAARTTSNKHSMIKVNFQLITNDTTKEITIQNNTANNNKNSKPMPCSTIAILL